MKCCTAVSNCVIDGRIGVSKIRPDHYGPNSKQLQIQGGSICRKCPTTSLGALPAYTAV